MCMCVCVWWTTEGIHFFVKMQSSLWPQEKLIFPACRKPAKLSTTACQHTCVELNKSWKTKISTSAPFCSKKNVSKSTIPNRPSYLFQCQDFQIKKSSQMQFFCCHSVASTKMYKTIERYSIFYYYFCAFRNKWNTRLKNCLQAQLLLRIIHEHGKLLFPRMWKFFYSLSYTLHLILCVHGICKFSHFCVAVLCIFICIDDAQAKDALDEKNMEWFRYTYTYNMWACR
jgi:hypothetical protein